MDANAIESILDQLASRDIPNKLDRDELYELQNDDGAVQIINPERYADAPRRTRGTVTHTTDESWLEYWNRQTGSSLDEIWADLDHRTVTAVFDAPTQDTPAWAEHRSVLNLKLSPQWQAWYGINDKPLAQTVFGEFLEDHPRDIIEPNSAEMLELVMDFEATPPTLSSTAANASPTAAAS